MIHLFMRHIVAGSQGASLPVAVGLRFIEPLTNPHLFSLPGIICFNRFPNDNRFREIFLQHAGPRSADH
jgi:hypothetical protein